MSFARPNILLITTDQQRTDTLGCYGASWVKTPHLDRLAAEGIRFDRAYCTSPVCTPSRASIFSGWLPSRHGAWNIGCNVGADVPFLSATLAAAGYRTHTIGKAHWQANTAPATQSVESLFDNPRFPAFTGPYYGFQTAEIAIGHAGYNLRAGHHAEWVRAQASADEFAAAAKLHRRGADFGGSAYDTELPTRWHNSVWTADRALAFLAEHSAREPFFLHLGFQDPHHPHAVPRDLAERVDAAAVPPPRFCPGELEQRPEHFLSAREGRLEQLATRGAHPMSGQGAGFDYRRVSSHDTQEARAYYYTLAQLIDREVGRVLGALAEHQLAANTIVLFTSDHGELLGDHGLWLKGAFPYEEVLRVPLICRWPAQWAAGRAIASPVSLVDLVPTLHAAAGLPAPEVSDGCDWHPCLSRNAAAPRTCAVIEYEDHPAGVCFQTFVTERYKLTRYPHARRAETHDLLEDPHEFAPLPATSAPAALHAMADEFAARPKRRDARIAYS